MLVHRSLEGLSIQKAVVTTGSFDGVHIGHKTILNRLRTIAREIGGTSVLVTFYPHPRKVLYPNAQGKDLVMINTQAEKIRLLEKAGLDHLVIIPFTLEFSKTSSVDFIRKILVEKLNASCVVVGFNHHFGHNREGNFDYLYELGKFYNFSVEEIPEQDIHNEFVSSTKIRKAIQEGNIQRANAYLDHEFFLMGPTKPASLVLDPNAMDWFEVFPEEEEKELPPPGIYAGSVLEGPAREKVMICITGKGPSRKVLIHFLSDKKHAPNDVFLGFHKRIRLLDADEPDSSPALFESDQNEIEELIY
jgi:riboflavin kinase/FMN adenylyltransferase